MIDPKTFFEGLKARGAGMFVGVPDSLLSSFCAYVDDHGDAREHIITANEGNAVALAAGYYLGTGKASVVYMQNSGLGNTVNPLTSLADREVYRIPMLLVIGWRGEPGVKDEPQHVKQGRITPGQLDLLEIPHWTVDGETQVESLLDEVFARLSKDGSPVALLVRKDAFNTYKSRRSQGSDARLEREDAIREILALCDPQDVVVSTTGKASRELFELRAARGDGQKDFLTVGGMGHTASIALGVALGQPQRRVVCLDGDGSVLMHMGALPIIGSIKPDNLVHVLLNNAAHESVGGQPTVADRVDFAALSRACGYRSYARADDAQSLKASWQSLAQNEGPALVEVKIRNGARADLGRPTSTPEQNKQAFMAHVRGV